jgi:hypothetical protein
MNQTAAYVLEQFNEGTLTPSICDKCGQIVNISNSARAAQEIATDGFAGFINDRHLFPEGACQGSPSRVNLVQTDSAWAAAYSWMQHSLK